MKNILAKTWNFVAVLLLSTIITLGVMGVLVIALDLPPDGSVAFIQTSGPNTGLNIGDWYTYFDEGNRPHRFIIQIPCTVDPMQTFTIELYDPEIYRSTTAVPIAIDEIRNAPNNRTDDNNDADVVTFTLFAPNDPGTPLVTQVYPPSDLTNDRWVNFASFDVNTNGCGDYTLLAETGNDDDNAWRLRVLPDNPDSTPGTGDEIALATFESSFQHSDPGCQSFHFFVPQTPTLRLNNFDLDYNPNPGGYDNTASIQYILPDGSTFAGTPSGGTVWNNGDGSNRGGDVFPSAAYPSPPPGWWEAQVCVTGTPIGNQYIFEPEGYPYFFEVPPIPEMEVSKDDGRAVVNPDETLTYTLLFTNTSDPNNGGSAAFNVILTDQLPTNTTYVPNSCAINTHGGTCSESGGVITFVITEPVAADSNGSAQFSVQVNSDATGTVFNSVTLDYQDAFGNQYPPETATDTDTIVTAGQVDLEINKTDGGVTTIPGGTVVYTITYANLSLTTDATGVVIAETVPANTTYNSTAAPGWTCVPDNNAGSICSWPTISTLAANTGGSTTFAVDVDASFADPSNTITNTVTISGNEPDPNPDNNRSTDTTPIIYVDPIITKRGNPDEASAGDSVYFSITILNPVTQSVIAATGVLLIEPMPAELDLVDYSTASDPGGLVDNVIVDSSETITVDIGVLDVGQSATLYITATVNNSVVGPTTIANTAYLEFNEGPPKNDTASLTVPNPNTSPNPKPGGGKDDDDDDDDSSASTSSSSQAVPQPPPAEPATLPVMFLPETGIGHAETNDWFALPLMGVMLAIYLWRITKKN